MNREDSYHKMLQAAAQLQWNISLILEAKAVEAARSCQWICQHMKSSHFEDHSVQVKKTVEMHEQLIEVIEGITKMEQALAKNMHVLLGQSEENEQGGGDYGDMFPFGGNAK
ncbi:hypothetical protein [Paenibacillus rigui]|uniref:Restriction endonuclease subunit S n=1 Tax=Paenibacillus rigui TaxID=554312 RepID=A0A229UJC7_9BACL|nr:hypothetical protein [Paenibacillus rigui]OXM83490.1 hypothetical protein CF651_25560 [Paenibacillus rigui]